MAVARDKHGKFLAGTGTGGIKVEGLDKLSQAIHDRSSRYEKLIHRAMIMAGLELQRDAMMLTPVEFGDLRRSAATTPVGAGFHTQVFVTFAQEYAVYVHEDMAAHHDVGQAKFLEVPAILNREAYAQIIVDEVFGS